MIGWIMKLLELSPSAAPQDPDPELMFLLRRELKECESLYRAGARLCVQDCPSQLGCTPKEFTKRMLELHRGLLLKLFVQVAWADGRWHRAERRVARVLLEHAWGVKPEAKGIVQVLENVREHTQSFTWDELLAPFVRFEPLNEHVAELTSQVSRIGNLIAKADGEVHPAEMAALTTIYESLREVFARKPKGIRHKAVEVKPGKQQIAIVPAKLIQSPPAASEPAPEPVLDAEARAGLLTAAMAELDQLIGLADLKRDIRDLISFLKIQDERKKHNLPQTSISMHTIFRGNPGTGKTTVARILGRAFGGLGILDKGHTIETDRSGLVAEYAGQTGPKVNERVNEALDGLLFVDEAYSLIAEQGEDAYGSEAVQVLLKRMEDDRERLIVVLAGYPEPMNRLLESNPGLSSRFQRTFNFPDYTADELLLIFDRMCEKNHYALPPASRDKLRLLFQTEIDHRDEHFGNGRLARNSFEQSIRCLATRIVGIMPLTRELLTTLQPEDIALDEK